MWGRKQTTQETTEEAVVPLGEFQVLARESRREHTDKRSRIWEILLMRHSEFLKSLV